MGFFDGRDMDKCVRVCVCACVRACACVHVCESVGVFVQDWFYCL